MKLTHGLHLAYCTNIHRGETWEQTLRTLNDHTLAVRDQVSPRAPYAIGLRLGHDAAVELAKPANLAAFQQWLSDHNCYVFTINGFPYGKFHGTRVKEHVYEPDWTSSTRLHYTTLLFDILAQLLPEGLQGSVSTVPGSFKPFIHSEDQVAAMRRNLWECVHHLDALAQKTGKVLHLGLEPEPLCYLETSDETVRFFEQLRADHPTDTRAETHLGVNYDTCHFAVEFEEPLEALQRLRTHGIRISKVHFSNALRLTPTQEIRQALLQFDDPVYFHQVVSRQADGTLSRYKDLDVALQDPDSYSADPLPEWRIHFHVPLHCQPRSGFQTTSDHITGVLDYLQQNPNICSHVEMETYTWEVLPPDLKNRNVVDQLVHEYRWTLDQLATRGFEQLPA